MSFRWSEDLSGQVSANVDEEFFQEVLVPLFADRLRSWRKIVRCGLVRRFCLCGSLVDAVNH